MKKYKGAIFMKWEEEKLYGQFKQFNFPIETVIFSGIFFLIA